MLEEWNDNPPRTPAKQLLTAVVATNKKAGKVLWITLHPPENQTPIAKHLPNIDDDQPKSSDFSCLLHCGRPKTDSASNAAKRRGQKLVSTYNLKEKRCVIKVRTRIIGSNCQVTSTKVNFAFFCQSFPKAHFPKCTTVQNTIYTMDIFSETTNI